MDATFAFQLSAALGLALYTASLVLHIHVVGDFGAAPEGATLRCPLFTFCRFPCSFLSIFFFPRRLYPIPSKSQIFRLKNFVKFASSSQKHDTFFFLLVGTRTVRLVAPAPRSFAA